VLRVRCAEEMPESSRTFHAPSQLCAAAFLIGGYNGSFFGASTDWDYAGDWANLLTWPWSNRTIGAALTPAHMEDAKGCGWDRQFEGANVTINFCTKHQYARIDWTGGLVSGLHEQRPEPCQPGAVHCDLEAAERPWPEEVVLQAAAADGTCTEGQGRLTIGPQREPLCLFLSRSGSEI
jgi:hypothetical protein